MIRVTRRGRQARLIKGPFQAGQIGKEIGATARRGSCRQKPGEIFGGPSGLHLGFKGFPGGRAYIRTANG